jgi:hypothetical protein
MDHLDSAERPPVLAALDALQNRFDGPIPEPLRAAALAGSALEAARIGAAADARFFAGVITRQLETIRQLRRAGRPVRTLINDLGFYRRERQRLRRVLHRPMALRSSSAAITRTLPADPAAQNGAGYSFLDDSSGVSVSSASAWISLFNSSSSRR